MDQASTQRSEQYWTETIEPKVNLLKIDFKELWQYRDLLIMFVKRDFVTYFKQTVLGPIWFFLTPVFTTLIFMIVFGNIAKISTDGIPQMAFYLSGVTLWSYFATCLNDTALVFSKNSDMMGKVYFPRLIMPLSIVVSKLMQFGVQFILFLLVVGYFFYQGRIQPNFWVLFSPFLVMLMAAFSLGLGLMFSSLTVKYRDMVQLLTFGVQLAMYATPVIYPVSSIPERYKLLIMANPLTPVFEAFKYGFLGSGDFTLSMLAYSAFVVTCVLLVGTIVFNRVEKSFMDSI